MMTVNDLLSLKKAQVWLHLNDIFCEQETNDWRTKHPTGPVHVQISCRLCGKVLADDLKDFGWLYNNSFVEKNLMIHLRETHL